MSLIEKSLRIVLNSCEINELELLRKENERLSIELNRWKGNATLPIVGKYYIPTDSLLELHGHCFPASVVALRFDRRTESLRLNGFSIVSANNSSIPKERIQTLHICSRDNTKELT